MNQKSKNLLFCMITIIPNFFSVFKSVHNQWEMSWYFLLNSCTDAKLVRALHSRAQVLHWYVWQIVHIKHSFHLYFSLVALQMPSVTRELGWDLFESHWQYITKLDAHVLSILTTLLNPFTLACVEYVYSNISLKTFRVLCCEDALNST